MSVISAHSQVVLKSNVYKKKLGVEGWKGAGLPWL